MPNITGSAQITRSDGYCWPVYNSTGALTSTIRGGNVCQFDNTRAKYDINTFSFAASLSSTVYGNSYTVTPLSLSILPILKY